nr:MAG TPA: hypothetical protein [Caudoviricetes sp.]
MDELKPGELTNLQSADVLEKLIPEIECGLNIHFYELAVLHRAVDVLRRPTPENKPLTLEQLRQMEGEPVWIQRGKKGTYRVVKDVSCGGTYGGEVRFTDSGPTGLRIEDYCKTWVPYARKPIQEDKNEKAD